MNIFGILERRLARQTGGALESARWAKTIVLAAALSFVLSFAALTLLSTPLLLTLVFSVFISCTLSYFIYTIPLLSAHRRIDGMERELRLLLPHLVSIYSERGSMREALLSVSDGKTPLGSEIRKSILAYEAGADAEAAFRRLTHELSSRQINRAFDFVVNSLKTGVDVTAGLVELSASTASSHELSEEKLSKTSSATWMIFASSVFFYPLFASFSLVIMDGLAKLALRSPYSASEKEFITLALLIYLFIGVTLDSSYVGQVRFNSFKRGLMGFFPAALLASLCVFFLSSILVRTFLGV